MTFRFASTLLSAAIVVSSAAAVTAITVTTANAADLKPLVIAEPIHMIGYLPLYVAIHKGYFAKEGYDVKLLTVESGSGHINAVLSHQALAFIGGPEHDAYAKVRGAELRTVVNVVNRGNIYLVAKKGLMPTGTDYAGFLKGKTVAVQGVGTTPNSIWKFLSDKWKLDPNSVHTAETTAAGVLAAVASGQAQVGLATEPQITQGIQQGIWSEPFYSIPKELGPYAYSTLNVLEDEIKSNPAEVESFVRAVTAGLKETYAHPDEAKAIARQEFPTMPAADLNATVDRSFKDDLWSHDGMVSPESWATAENVVLKAGILKQPVAYNDIIDMQFVKKIAASGK